MPAARVAIKPTSEELHDLAAFAAQHDMSLETAISRYAWRHGFARIVDRLRTAHRGSYAGAGAGPGYGAWVAFKGAAPAETRRALAGLPVPVEVREFVGWSESEVVSAANALHYAVRSDRGLAASVATDPDTTRGVIRVSVRPHAGALDATTRSRLAAMTNTGAVAAALDAVPDTVDVQVVADADLAGGVDTVYGGGSLSSCTAGFPVRRSTDTTQHGLTTAGHCGNSQSYEGRSVLTFIAAHEGSQGDMQWHRSSEAVGNQFYYDSGLRRNAQYVGNPTLGMSVCKYGKTSGATCDEIYRLNQCRDAYCGLAMTHRRKAAGGDSGGPWYWGTTAYGVHSGWKTVNLINRDMFTPVQQVHITLGLLLKTS